MSYQWDDNCIQFNAVEIARDGGRTERKLVVHRVTHLTFWKCKHLLWLCLWIKYLTSENSRIHFVSMQIWTRMTSLTHFRFSLCQPGSKRQQFGRLTEMKMTAARERRFLISITKVALYCYGDREISDEDATLKCKLPVFMRCEMRMTNL